MQNERACSVGIKDEKVSFGQPRCLRRVQFVGHMDVMVTEAIPRLCRSPKRTIAYAGMPLSACRSTSGLISSVAMSQLLRAVHTHYALAHQLTAHWSLSELRREAMKHGVVAQ